MFIPKFYSVTSIDILPENRNVNGIYHLRTEDGFKVYRVSNTADRDFIELKAPVSNTLHIMQGVAHEYLVEPGVDYVIITSATGSKVELPPASQNKGRVITLMGYTNNDSNIYRIEPKIFLRPSGFGIDALRFFTDGASNEPAVVTTISDGENWIAVHTRH